MTGWRAVWLAGLPLAAMIAGCSSAGSQGDAAGAEVNEGATFDCGGATACQVGVQVCENVAGGAPPGVDFYACIATPPACRADPSCDCVLAQLKAARGATTCSSNGGGLTVDISVP